MHKCNKIVSDVNLMCTNDKLNVLKCSDLIILNIYIYLYIYMYMYLYCNGLENFRKLDKEQQSLFV